MGRKRQQQIYFRSLALPSSGADSDGEDKSDGITKKSDYSPHFLAALQLIAHVIIPVRKALIHFYVSYRNKDVTKLEWLTLLGFGRLFRDLITASNSSGNSVLSGGSSTANTGSVNGNGLAQDDAALGPVSTERFFPVLYTCLLKHDLQKWPTDATEAVRVLLECLKKCSTTLPVVNQLWSALLDKACLGLIASQSLVGRRKPETADAKDIKQRSMKEQVILWFPHVVPIADVARIPPASLKTNGGDNDDDDDSTPVPTLQQLLEAEFRKRPLSSTSRKYYDFDKKSFDFEVQIPTRFLDPKEKDDDENKDEAWMTTRSMEFVSVPGFLFLGIDRTTPQPQKGKEGKAEADAKSESNFDRLELAIPSQLNLTKLCSKQNRGSKATLPSEAIYELVGGALNDDGDYVAVLKDFSAVSLAEEKKSNSNSNLNSNNDDDDDDDETWKLMESEETIPMSESDILEFLKGEGNDEEDDDEEEEHGPCGTLAVYRLKPPTHGKDATKATIFDEMNQLVADIVISQVSGSFNSKTDFYIEEEIFEEEIIED